MDLSQNDVELWGNEASGNFGLIDIIAMPCHVKEKKLGAVEEGVSDDCVRDKELYRKYLGTSQNLVFYANQESF